LIRTKALSSDLNGDPLAEIRALVRGVTRRLAGRIWLASSSSPCALLPAAITSAPQRFRSAQAGLKRTSSQAAQMSNCYCRPGKAAGLMLVEGKGQPLRFG